MITRQQILDFIATAPGVTNKDIAHRFAMTEALASTRTKQMLDLGYVTRKDGPPVKGRPTYKYYVAAGTEGKPKQERLSVVRDIGSAPMKQKPSPEPLVNEKPIVESSLDSLVSGFVSGFADTLAQAIVSQLKPKLEDALKRALPVALPAPPVITEPPKQEFIPKEEKKRLPVIGIIGIAPPKRAAILEEFGDIFEIVFWWSEENEHIIKSMASRCQMVFVMHYVGHRHTQMISARGGVMRRITGDINALTEAMTSYFLEVAA